MRIDALGRACPTPLLLITRALRDVAPGGTVQITTDDRAFPKDVAAWCAHQGHELVELVSKDGVHDATIRRGAK